MRAERWLPIVGHEGLYEVSDLGRIRRSAPGISTHVGKVLKQDRTARGYMNIKLCKKGAMGNKSLVHSLVMRSFIGEYPDGKEVNHKDGNKENNSLSNLEYVTGAENVRHALVNGLYARGEAHGLSRLTEKEVLSIREELEESTQKVVAIRHNVALPTIGDISRGKTWAWLK